MNIEKNATYWDVEHSKKIYEILKYCTAEFRHWLWRFILKKGKIIFFKAFSSLLIYKFKNWFYNFANSDPYLCGKLKHTSHFRNRCLWLIKTIIIKKYICNTSATSAAFFFCNYSFVCWEKKTQRGLAVVTTCMIRQEKLDVPNKVLR